MTGVPGLSLWESNLDSYMLEKLKDKGSGSWVFTCGTGGAIQEVNEVLPPF